MTNFPCSETERHNHDSGTDKLAGTARLRLDCSGPVFRGDSDHRNLVDEAGQEHDRLLHGRPAIRKSVHDVLRFRVGHQQRAGDQRRGRHMAGRTGGNLVAVSVAVGYAVLLDCRPGDAPHAGFDHRRLLRSSLQHPHCHALLGLRHHHVDCVHCGRTLQQRKNGQRTDRWGIGSDCSDG